jgi:hypothetical protein
VLNKVKSSSRRDSVCEACELDGCEVESGVFAADGESRYGGSSASAPK